MDDANFKYDCCRRCMGGSGYSFVARLSLSSSNSGYGKVYASKSQDNNVSDNSFQASSSADSGDRGQQQGAVTMYLYAKECRGGKI